MDIIILSIFAIVVALAFLEDYIPSWQKLLILIGLGMTLICVSTFKPMTTTDAGTYEYYFYCNDNEIVETATEPTYIYLSRLILSYGGEVGVLFFIYAMLAIPLKFAAMWKLTPHIFTAMMVYIGINYPLHDVVQIRCGVASAFLLMSLYPLEKRQYWKVAALLVCATLFHYSSLAVVPIYLFGNIKITRVWKIILALAIPVCIAMYVLHIGIFSFLPFLSSAEGKMDLYQDMSEQGGWDEYVPYKQVTFLVEFMLLYLLLFFYDTIEKRSPYAPIIIKVLVLEMAYMTVFADIPVLGARLHELLGTFNIIAYTYCLYCIKPHWIAKCGICVVVLAHYVIQMMAHHYFPA